MCEFQVHSLISLLNVHLCSVLEHWIWPCKDLNRLCFRFDRLSNRLIKWLICYFFNSSKWATFLNKCFFNIMDNEWWLHFQILEKCWWAVLAKVRVVVSWHDFHIPSIRWRFFRNPLVQFWALNTLQDTIEIFNFNSSFNTLIWIRLILIFKFKSATLVLNLLLT